MADKGLDEFLAAAKTDQAILGELRALEGKTYDEYYAGFVAAGATRGYTFTVDEVEEVTDEALSDQTLKSGELSDDQLEAVAGGKGGGAGGVLIGVINMVVDKLTGG